MCESVVWNTRKTSVVADTLIKEGCKAVVVVPMMFVSENHGYVTLWVTEMILSHVVLHQRWMRSIVC